MIHKTKSGTVELVYKWGHGKGTMPPRRVAHFCTDDNDGHYAQWCFTGKRNDAMEFVAQFLLNSDGRYVIERYGDWLNAIPKPDDFWIETETGDFTPNLARYPMVLAY